MMRSQLTPAASGLLRAILARAGEHRDRIFLSHIRSVDWQSLTFMGERHTLDLVFSGDAAEALMHQTLGGIEEAEFDIRGHLVADITIGCEPLARDDGSLCVTLEALTVAA